MELFRFKVSSEFVTRKLRFGIKNLIGMLSIQRGNLQLQPTLSMIKMIDFFKIAFNTKELKIKLSQMCEQSRTSISLEILRNNQIAWIWLLLSVLSQPI